MGSSSSSETPPTGRSNLASKSHKKQSKKSQGTAEFQARVAQIVAEESRKQNESRAAQAARDARIKELMRDVLKESEAKKKSSSPAEDSGARNTMIISMLTDLLASRANDPDKSKIINQLLDVQQQLGNSVENASIAKFLKQHLETLQPSQDVKITVEKKSSTASASGQQHNLGDRAAGPSWGSASGGNSAQANVPPSPMAPPNVPPRPFPPYSERPRDLFLEENHFRGPAANPNVGTFPVPPPSYTDTLLTDHMQQASLNPPPLHNPQQNYRNVAPPQNYANRPSAHEGQSFNVRTPQDNQYYLKKNQQRQMQNNATYEKNRPSNDNSPFLDKGPPLHEKNVGCRVETGSDGNFYVSVPPPLMDFPSRGNYANNGPNRGHGRGRGGPDLRRGGHDLRRGGHDPRRGGHDPRGGGHDPRRGGHDPRRSESPHHTQQNRYQNREESFPGVNQETGQNQRGGFQYRGRGPRRPMQFPGRGNYSHRGHNEHYQQAGGQDNVYHGTEEPYSQGEYFDPRFKQNEPGGHQTRPSRPGRWNHSNPNTRSASQPRTRNVHYTQEMPNDLGKGGNQTTDNKQGNNRPRGQYKPRGAFPKRKPKEGAPKPKYKQRGQDGTFNIDPQNDGDDSDLESVMSDVSTKTNPKSNFKEGVYIIREDGTIFTTVAQSMVDLSTAEAKKKKKKYKPKNKVKKASDVSNASVPQNDASEDSQSDELVNEGTVTEGKEEESTSPLKLFLGGLDDKALENLEPDEVLGHSIVVIAKVDASVKSYHPTTVGELVDLKKKYPNAEIIVVN